MSTLLIVNPYATGVGEQLVDRVAAVLPQPVSTVLTQAPGSATELARELEGHVEAVVVFSGDGTYNEVLNGATGRTPLGFVPGGGTSVLARALGLPRDPVAAAERIAAMKTRRISLGRANGRRFGFSCGIGLDAELVRRVDQRGRSKDGRRPGDAAFLAAGLRMIGAHRGHFRPALEIDGLGRAAFAFVANCDPYTYLGSSGLRIAPRATFEGGLDIVAPIEIGIVRSPGFAWRVLRGGLDRDPNVLYAHDLDRALIRCDRPLPLQVDGEDLGDVDEVEITAERDAVTVLV